MMTILIATVLMAAVGLALGAGLALLDRFLKVEQDGRVGAVAAMLPGVNCGACGKPGCAAYAQAVVKERTMFNGCIPGGAELNAKIAAFLGLESKGSDRMKVLCRCLSCAADQKRSFAYRGPASCAVAHAAGGTLDCRFGCVGFGDCVKVCPVGALTLVDAHVAVDNTKCIDCGKCVRTCPRSLFFFANVGTDKTYCVVGCNNPEPGPEVKKVCDTGCIGCGLCTRVIPDSPFSLEAKVSRIDYAKARGRDLSAAVAKCPQKIIKQLEG